MTKKEAMAELEKQLPDAIYGEVAYTLRKEWNADEAARVVKAAKILAGLNEDHIKLGSKIVDLYARSVHNIEPEKWNGKFNKRKQFKL